MKKNKIFIVPHAHWDKEWYFTKQESDVLLNINLKNLFSAFENDKEYKSFSYDGQTSIVDDFLTYEKSSDILKYIKNKKLFVGPWYSQPDLFNTTSEGIVRNLLIGTTLANEYGNCMKIAYVPDSFGQPNQMPQIYQQADLQNLVYWRGVKKEQLENSVLHYWEGIDGTKIKAVNLLLGYWVMGAHFPYNDLNENNAEEMGKIFLQSFEKTLKRILDFNKKSQNKILIPLGGDQAPINKNLAKFFKALNKLDKENEWIWSDYEEYFSEVEDIKNLPTITGELKYPQSARIHKTIASQRYDIKKLLKENDNIIFDKLEPLLIFFENINGSYPQEIVNEAIKKCLVSSAHDSLGGCNSDETNADVTSRLRQANDIVKSTTIAAMRYISRNFSENSLTLFNPSVKDELQNFEITLFTKTKDFELVSKNSKIKYFVISQEFINDEIEINTGTMGESLAGKDGYYKTRIFIKDLFIPAFSLQNYDLKPLKKLEHKTFSKIENDTWKVEMKKGCLQILNKKLNHELKEAFKLNAYVDAGDSYDFSPLTEMNDAISKFISNEFTYTNYDEIIIIKEKRTYEIVNNKTQKIDIEYIFNNNGEISTKIKMDNQLTKIKWTIDSDVNFKNEYSYASQAFCEIKRPVVIKENEIWKENKWAEKPHPIETNESFVYLKNDKVKFGAYTYGTNEYEITKKDFSTLSLTLFRSVEFLGLHNLLWRPGRASGTGDFPIRTRDSEMKGDLEFNIVFFLEESNTITWKNAQSKLSSPIWYQKQVFNKYFHKFERFFITNLEKLNLKTNFSIKLLNDEIIVKSFKKCEKSNDYVLRVFNPTTKSVDLKIEGNIEILGETNLVETKREKYDKVIESMKIKTILIKGKG